MYSDKSMCLSGSSFCRSLWHIWRHQAMFDVQHYEDPSDSGLFSCQSPHQFLFSVCPNCCSTKNRVPLQSRLWASSPQCTRPKWLLMVHFLPIMRTVTAIVSLQPPLLQYQLLWGAQAAQEPVMVCIAYRIVWFCLVLLQVNQMGFL